MVERSELAPSARFAALVSRQYAEMSRIRIEGLLAAFPKLVGTGKQHTYVETENVRYVYQPIEVSGQCSNPGFQTGLFVSIFCFCIACFFCFLFEN